jgi:hypothetical protein
MRLFRTKAACLGAPGSSFPSPTLAASHCTPICRTSMKKFALLIYNDPTLLDAIPPQEFDATMRDCLAHADELRQEGRLLDSQMLESAASAKSVRVRKGRRTIVDGPFTETKELLAGFNLIEAEDIEEAVRIAEQFPWVSTGCVEVREVKDIAAVRERVSAADSAVA